LWHQAGLFSDVGVVYMLLLHPGRVEPVTCRYGRPVISCRVSIAGSPLVLLGRSSSFQNPEHEHPGCFVGWSNVCGGAKAPVPECFPASIHDPSVKQHEAQPVCEVRVARHHGPSESPASFLRRPRPHMFSGRLPISQGKKQPFRTTAGER